MKIPRNKSLKSSKTYYLLKVYKKV